jgi:glycosyltransferase involved in cell wall biosynthesis
MRAQASIVIPLLRQREAWLQRAVESALVQTTPAEVVVITSPDTPASNTGVLEACARRADGRLVVARRTIAFGRLARARRD